VTAGPTVKQILDTYAGKVRLVIKNYPYKYRDFSKIAAEASLAAQEQGRYWDMHDIMLRNSPKLARADLNAYAEQLGLDQVKFNAALDKSTYAKKVEDDLKLAESIDLYNTPTFFINGRQIVGERPFAFFQKIIDEILQSQR
jgi:protein-disulfide isomerase